MSAIPGFSSPSADFDEPLEMLRACHERMTHQCRTLVRLADHLPVHGADAPARDAAKAVLRYFDVAAPRHHEDEEIDLFPALLESMAGSDAVCLRGLCDGLVNEHHEFDRQWRALRAMLEPIASGQSTVLDAELAQRFRDLHATHIERENSELLPMAERLIAPEVMDAIGEAMRRRRTTGASGP